MRHMSFALTTPQMLARTKTVTRRTRWLDVKLGTLLQAIEKGQGLKKGEKVRKLGVIRVIGVRREPLRLLGQPVYGDREAVLEGFPDLSGPQFLRRFLQHSGLARENLVTRIEFEHVDAPEASR
jgi:hypothetical protein